MVDVQESPSAIALEYVGEQRRYENIKEELRLNRRMEYKQRSSAMFFNNNGSRNSFGSHTHNDDDESYDSLIGERVPGVREAKAKLLMNQP